METRRTDSNHDPLPIVEDDQQLYDWGIEHRLDQYYGESQAPPAHGAPAHYQAQYNQTAQTAQQPHSASPASSPSKPSNTVGYVLPEHVQRAQENAAYLVTTMGSANNEQKSIKQTTVLPISPPLHGGQLLVKSENNYKRNLYKQPLNIKPNGIPGRRPILPTVDMDANEVLKVERKRARNRVAASKCRMRKLERISVLDHQANQLRTENEQLVKLADKLRSQVYSLKQELRWHINNGCRLQQSPVLDQLDHPNQQQQEFLVPTTLDKATETSMTNAQYEMYEDSPDSTTSSTSTSVSIKQEPGYDEAHQRVAI